MSSQTIAAARSGGKAYKRGKRKISKKRRFGKVEREEIRL